MADVDLAPFARDAAAALVVVDGVLRIDAAKRDELHRRALIVPPDDRWQVCQDVLAVATRMCSVDATLDPSAKGNVVAFDELVALAALVLGNGNRNADGFETTDPAQRMRDFSAPTSPSADAPMSDAPVLTPPRGRIRA